MTAVHPSGEEVLEGGGLTDVVRRGDRVHRTAGPWTPSVHRLLSHLRANGVDEVPAPHGLDGEGREVLDHLPGVVPNYPMPDWAWHEDALVGAARLLGRLHAGGADLVEPMRDATWRVPLIEPAEVICHNDAAPYNLVFADGRPVGIIDHDFSAPGPRVRDVAYLAYRMVPIAHPCNEDLPSFHGPATAARLERLCAAYAEASAGLGLPPLTPDDVLAALPARLDDIATHAFASGQGDHAALYRRDADHARRLARADDARPGDRAPADDARQPSPAPAPGAEVETATWAPLRSVAVGPWLAGLSDGFTKRANSLVPTPADLDRVAVTDLVEQTESLYREAGLPATFCLRGEGEQAALLADVLDERGYDAAVPAWVMAARLDGGLIAEPDALATRGGTLETATAPTVEWTTAWLCASGRGGDPALDAVPARVLTNSDVDAVVPSRYLAVRDDAQRLVAVARVAYATARDGSLWAALSSLAVAPEARRRGLGRATSLAAAALAAADGAERLLLQVEEDNRVVRPLYESLGLGYVDRYVYRTLGGTRDQGC